MLVDFSFCTLWKENSHNSKSRKGGKVCFHCKKKEVMVCQKIWLLHSPFLWNKVLFLALNKFWSTFVDSKTTEDRKGCTIYNYTLLQYLYLRIWCFCQYVICSISELWYFFPENTVLREVIYWWSRNISCRIIWQTAASWDIKELKASGI